VTAASAGTVSVVKVPWDDGRCIFCAATGPMTDGHVIPRAAGGRLSAPFECAQCNGLLGSSVEARLTSDPAMRLAVEALGDRLGPLGIRLRQRQPYVNTDDGVVVRAVVEGSAFRLRDTQQPDHSLVKDRPRAREDVATTLERRGADAAEIAAALERLEAAPLGALVELGRGVAFRHGAVTAFSPELASAYLVPAACLVAVAYRYLALVAGRAVFAAPLDGVRRGLLAGLVDDTASVDVLLAERPYEPWHGLAVLTTWPVVIDVRLFGRLAWHVTFSGVGLADDYRGAAYRLDLVQNEESFAVVEPEPASG
jgi:hypothetical protein